ncbi:hypothetical protein AGABI2DRAFT_189013 [Agaricus bisporus var. bisporus H97]|uniref:hypothetical protein n=1 Tax=Agaricus bisporus var. bisporus (strain H97 / ATCC MYA-4626 / FGSC 10389) TaxID=936046 RepID=UPI00029F6455|nr:hypothetical protein AGABI2DRAFT_189013 [Agaricus bisporus var. bisporus H97]EKV41875.1 hypothetical protein AGABI2DRAFT_189013 [Agaricus bisporus var. bisporus H97]
MSATAKHAGEPASPEDGSNLRRSLQIDMKGLVGDAVGNMSISPSSRDIVLAARRGLFILDLESPLEVPRFLPQGGTWDVADIQWNPHPQRDHYIVSTSSEKLLIWNLLRVGKSSIEHILNTGIDSWVYAWDLREPSRPIFAGGTQVKWNRRDSNILASSHANGVFIWDRRKGSLPISSIVAHDAKIYGIDWSSNSQNELTTCSLDKTIKTWDINDCLDAEGAFEPKSIIRTTYPVWRALSLPFGQGLLSLPQRGETVLEMYASNDSEMPVEVFAGHTDVVKEFVWRKGGPDEFQLITWSKDRTLRFWPISNETLQNVDHFPEPTRGRSRLSSTRNETISYRNPPECQVTTPSLSNPIGNRAILAEVRAPLPPQRHYQNSNNPVVQPHYGSAARASTLETHMGATSTKSTATPAGTGRVSTSTGISLPRSTTVIPPPPLSLSATKPIAVDRNRNKGLTMSRGNVGGKSVARMDAFTWLSSVKVGGRRGDKEGSSGATSGVESDAMRRLPSPSRSRTADDKKEGEGQLLQEEITSVLTKLDSSKIKLEKHDLAKKRTCTLGLHGPWGERSSVFIRITFAFPREYPQAGHPEGTPLIDLERSPLVSLKYRAFMLKRLKAIREHKRPCLEACLRFLLFGDEDSITDGSGRFSIMDGESSDDDDAPTATTDGNNVSGSKKKSKEVTVSLLRNHKNLAEPRTTQGAFGPNGELICFFRAPPRVSKPVLRNIPGAKLLVNELIPRLQLPQTPTPLDLEEEQRYVLKPREQQQQPQIDPSSSRMFSSPALLSEALRHLSMVAVDRSPTPDSKRYTSNKDRYADSKDAIHITTGLLSLCQYKDRKEFGVGEFQQQQQQRIPMAQASSSTPNHSTAVVTVRRSMMFASNINWLAGPDKPIAAGYIFQADSLVEVCEVNAMVAKEFRRFDHERVWKSLSVLLKSIGPSGKWLNTESESFAKQMFMKIYDDFAKNKDIQMLAMVSVLMLQTPYAETGVYPSPVQPTYLQRPSINVLSSSIRNARSNSTDYFSAVQGLNQQHPTSPITPAPLAPSLSSSTSSRNSWASIFGAGRQFVQETFHPTLATHADIDRDSISPSSEKPKTSENIAGGSGSFRRRKDSHKTVMSSATTTSQSWTEKTVVPQQMRKSISSGGSTLTIGGGGVSFPSAIRIRVVLALLVLPKAVFSNDLIRQMIAHVHVYAELLFRWQMYEKRIELLKIMSKRKIVKEEHKDMHYRLGIVQTCTHCGQSLPQNSIECHTCHVPRTMALCSICRLPVKGLSRNCLQCHHIAHISCWDTLEVPICPTGCGCLCSGYLPNFSSQESNPTRPSTRLTLSPPLPTALILS